MNDSPVIYNPRTAHQVLVQELDRVQDRNATLVHVPQSCEIMMCWINLSCLCFSYSFDTFDSNKISQQILIHVYWVFPEIKKYL